MKKFSNVEIFYSTILFNEIGTALAEKARSLVVKLKFALNLDKICIEFLF